MATHNLMDYSLLLITERNQDFNEHDNVKTRPSIRLHHSNTSDPQSMKEKSDLLWSVPQGIPEVLEEDEDDEGAHSELKNKLRDSAKSG